MNAGKIAIIKINFFLSWPPWCNVVLTTLDAYVCLPYHRQGDNKTSAEGIMSKPKGWTGCHNLCPNIHISYDNCIRCCTCRCTLFLTRNVQENSQSSTVRLASLPAFPSTTAQLTGIHVQSNECQYVSPASSCYASMLTSSYSLLCIHQSGADTPCPLHKNFPRCQYTIMQLTYFNLHHRINIVQ